MSVTFTKLFTSITESTIWQEDDHTRIMWITMLAMADRNGRVFGSIPGLASRARVPLPSAETALQRFQAPDPYSRTPDHEGRRIETIDGGWRLLNYAKYRELRDEESIKESKRRYINERRRREREAKRLGVEPSVEKVDRCRCNAEAEAEAETESFERKNERTCSAKSEHDPFKAISIPEELRSNPEFLEAWELHVKNLREQKAPNEALALAKRQLGMCKKWKTKGGIEAVLKILDGALAGGSTFLLDEGRPQ